LPGKNQIVYAILLLIVVVLLNLPLPLGMRVKAGARDNLAPFQNGLSLLVNRGRDVFSLVGSALTGVEEREEMLEEIAGLRRELWRLRSLEQDNRALRKLVGFKEDHERKLLLCEVVSRGDTTGWWQKIRLNRGSAHGVTVDMAVISTSGLVGRTRAVSRYTCDVLLMTDPGSRVACKFAGTEAYGIVTGTGVAVDEPRLLEMLYAVRPARMDYIPRDASLIAGAEIMTSGLGGVYPEGLLLGRVTAIYEQPHKLYRQADVMPAADMSSLRYVFVVLE